MSNQKVNFGLIGYGLFGQHHAAAIDRNSDTELVAIAVASGESRARAGADHPHATVTGDYLDVISRDDVDVVDIVVPNHLHFEIAHAALKHGKNLFLEKPMALEIEECDRLNELARSQGCFIAINHELRHSVLWGRIRQLIDEGAIGRPQYALIELSRFPYRQGSQGWRWDIDRVGNWILEEPIHFFDLARWYLTGEGEPVSVYARANSRHPDKPQLTDNFSAVMGYETGAYAIVSQTLSAFGHSVSGIVTGTEGSIKARWSADDARSDQPVFELLYGLGEKMKDVTPSVVNGELIELEKQIEMLVRCVRLGEEPICTGTDGRWSTALCLHAQESVASGKIVEVK